MSNEIESLIKIYPFAKPTVRSEAPKTVGAFEKLHALQTSRSSVPNKYAWKILRLLSYGQIRYRVDMKHRILPFLFGQDTSQYHCETLISHCG